MSNLTVSSEVDAFMQQTTLAGMFHAIVSFGTIDTANKILTISGGASGGLYVVGSGVTGQNALGLTAGTNGDYSAVAFFDVDDGNAYGAVGYGNSNSNAQYKGTVFIEGCDLKNTSGTPSNIVQILQTSFRTGGRGGYAGARRIYIGTDLGDIVLTAFDSTTNQTTFTFNSSGLLINNALLSQGIVGYDSNFCVIFRQNGNSYSNTYYCFGGSGANTGHLLYTGGVQASQVLRLQVADNAITAYELFFPQQAATVSAPSYVKGAMYFDLTLNKLRIGGASGWETVTSI